LSFVDGMGLKTFVARAKQLAAKYGPQFEPGDKLAQMAERGETFYGTHGKKQKAA
jgi:3-hydroxyacyl-CoA dehydrogenase / enoyl-CoA hydratase / 3-hydroxybutyryl-CoA epimerase